MKRRILCLALLTALLVLPAGFSPAESQTIPSIRDTMTEEKPRFSFRNGIQWGMSPEQVRASETVEMTERSSGEWSVMVTASPVEVSRFSADLVFMFQTNALQMITYEFQQHESSLNYQYLTGALCAVYGESAEANASEIKGYMDRIYQDRYRLDWINRALVWNHEDGTRIFLYYFSGDAFAILYVNPEMAGKSGGYLINGL